MKETNTFYGLLDKLYRLPDKTVCGNAIGMAYNLLVDALNNEKATFGDLSEAMEDAIGYLGQALAE